MSNRKIKIGDETFELYELVRFLQLARGDYERLRPYGSIMDSTSIAESIIIKLERMQAELDAARSEKEGMVQIAKDLNDLAEAQKAEIARLREGYVLLDAIDALFDAKEYYMDSDNHDEYAKLYVIKEEMRTWDEYIARFPYMRVTSVTLNDDTQELPEQLPFDGSPENTSKFKVGDRVQKRRGYYAKGAFDTIASVEWDNDRNQFGYQLLHNGKNLGILNWFDDELEHAD